MSSDIGTELPAHRSALGYSQETRAAKVHGRTKSKRMIEPISESSDERNKLEVLAEEFLERRRRGESPSISEQPNP